MSSDAFDKPVRVALGPAGNVTYVVSTPLQAAQKLLNEWPDVTGNRQLAARKAVLKAMENAQDALLRAKARKAFEEAAREAGILQPEPPQSIATKAFKSPYWSKRKR
jgi:hypothetical protein